MWVFGPYLSVLVRFSIAAQLVYARAIFDRETARLSDNERPCLVRAIHIALIDGQVLVRKLVYRAPLFCLCYRVHFEKGDEQIARSHPRHRLIYSRPPTFLLNVQKITPRRHGRVLLSTHQCMRKRSRREP